MVTGCSREEKIYHTSWEIHHLPQTAPAALLWLMIHQLLLELFSSKKHACFWLQCNNILYTHHTPRIEVLLVYALVYGDDSCTQERKKIQKLTDCNDCSNNNLNHSHSTQPQNELKSNFFRALWLHKGVMRQSILTWHSLGFGQALFLMRVIHFDYSIFMHVPSLFQDSNLWRSSAIVDRLEILLSCNQSFSVRSLIHANASMFLHLSIHPIWWGG